LIFEIFDWGGEGTSHSCPIKRAVRKNHGYFVEKLIFNKVARKNQRGCILWVQGKGLGVKKTRKNGFFYRRLCILKMQAQRVCTLRVQVFFSNW
jgi:hypothetical protein